MKQCKYCQAELDQEQTVCPVCGRDNAGEAPAETAEAQTQTAPAQEQPQEIPTQEQPQEIPTQEQTVEAPTQEQPQEAPTEGQAPEGPTQVPAAAPMKEGVKATPGKIALAVAAVVVLAAALIALILAGLDRDEDQVQASTPTEQTQAETAATTPATVPADGDPDSVTCKGTYTVTDEQADASRDQVVATMGDAQLTNARLRVYYWMEVQAFLSTYGSYAPYFGLDYTQPLDTQVYPQDESLTWQQYFLQCALTNWNQVQALGLEAEKAGLEMSQEERDYLDALPASLEEMAQGYSITLEELMKSNIGPGAAVEDYIWYEENYYRGAPYYNAETEKLVPTDQELEEFFEAHEEDYASGGVSREDLFVDVRHILFTPEGGATDENGATTYSDDEWAACEAQAQAVLDEWLAGERTEERFAQLAQEHSQDPGSSANGGLYENVYEGQMVQTFNDWCFDESRAVGDYGLVRTDYGYHVMYFQGSAPQWRYYAESDWVQERTQEFLGQLVAAHPMEVDYGMIELGLVDFNG